MCREAQQNDNSLITAQNHGTILVMVAWFLACLLAFCAVSRIVCRLRSQRLRSLSPFDDAIIVTASLCGIGAAMIISTAVDSGLGKRLCLISPTDLDVAQIKVFVSTILVIFALSISKCSILLFLHQVAETSLQRLGVKVIGFVVLIWTLAVMAGIVFECEMPTPWAIWTGKCIPLLPFWITATIIDMIIDVTLILLSAHLVWTSNFEYNQKALVSVLFSLRIILVGLSSVRLLFLQRALSTGADPTFDYIPYAISTQAQSATSIIVACSLMLKPFTSLLEASKGPLLPKNQRHSKHWSGTTIGGAPYESFESFASKSPIVKEPLHRIQGSMSSIASRDSLDPDILLPEILLPTRLTKAPPRPPPPADSERPDLSMFTRSTTIREPPMVTRLGSIRDKAKGSAWEKVGQNRSLEARGLS